MRAWNWLFKKVNKIRIEGPLDQKIQQQTIGILNKIKSSNTEALVIVINSYGGSLRVAKNISYTLSNLRSHKIPIYCFAEQFCLNSANIILTAGNRCFANKLSIIGDFGYVYQNYEFDEFKKQFNVGLETISNSTPKVSTYSNYYQYNDQAFINKWVNNSADELKRQVFNSRQQQLSSQKISYETFEQKILKGGTINPSEALKLGLIDGLLTYNSFLKTNFPGRRIKEDKQGRQYRAKNFLRNTLEIFKE